MQFKLDILDSSCEVIYIRDQITLDVIEDLNKCNRAGLDIESCNKDWNGMDYGLDPHRGTPRLIQLTPEHKKYTYIFDLYYLPKDQSNLLKKLLYNIKQLVIHNAVYEIKMLWSIDIDITNCNLYCSMVAEYILTNGLGVSRSLKEVTNKYLGLDISKEEQLSDWSKPDLTIAQLRYAALDSYLVLPVREKQKELGYELNNKYLSKHSTANIFKIFKIEFEFLPIIASLEYNGLPLDLSLWQRNLPTLQQQLIEEEVNILKLLPDAYQQRTFNNKTKYSLKISSNKQLLEQLLKLGVPTETTNEKDLTLLGISNYPVLVHLFKYREVSKIINTYLLKAPNWLNPVTNRVHPTYYQLGDRDSKSGRIQVKQPSIFTVPRDRSFRECFISNKEDEWFLDLDYAQVESRVTAVAANESKMLEVFNNNLDIYAATGAYENNLTVEELLSYKISNFEKFIAIRQAAKPEVLGLGFGMGVDRYRDYLEQEFRVIKTREEAKEQRSRFLYQLYPRLPQWHKECWKIWEGKDYIFNQNGRIYFGQIDYAFSINYGVQSLATDFFKQACGQIYKYLKSKYGLPILNKSPIYFVCYWHDAATFNGKKEVLELEQPVIESMMSKYAEEMLDYKVKIKAEGKVEKDWYLAHA